jgi:hypothetical protein
MLLCVYKQDKQLTCNVKMRRAPATTVAVEKTLGIQHAMRLRHIAICDLGLSIICFPNYLINGAIFEKILLNLKRVFRF